MAAGKQVTLSGVGIAICVDEKSIFVLLDSDASHPWIRSTEPVYRHQTSKNWHYLLIDTHRLPSICVTIQLLYFVGRTSPVGTLCLAENGAHPFIFFSHHSAQHSTLSRAVIFAQTGTPIREVIRAFTEANAHGLLSSAAHPVGAESASTDDVSDLFSVCLRPSSSIRRRMPLPLLQAAFRCRSLRPAPDD